MEATQRFRAELLQPLLKNLSALGCRPGLITTLSAIAGVAFAPLWFFNKPAALGALGLHVILDGIDGPLARFLGRASAKGSFTDTMADQVVIAAVTLTLMHADVVGTLVGSLYMLLYTVVVGFAMIRNAMRIPYAWLIRPRFAVYSWLVIETYLWRGSIDYLLWTSTALFALKLISGFVRIRRAL